MLLVGFLLLFSVALDELRRALLSISRDELEAAQMAREPKLPRKETTRAEKETNATSSASHTASRFLRLGASPLIDEANRTTVGLTLSILLFYSNMPNGLQNPAFRALQLSPPATYPTVANNLARTTANRSRLAHTHCLVHRTTPTVLRAAERDRYVGIQNFFHRIALERGTSSLPLAAAAYRPRAFSPWGTTFISSRNLHSTSLRSKEDKKDSILEPESVQGPSQATSPRPSASGSGKVFEGQKKDPFGNYPRSLRDLAHQVTVYRKQQRADELAGTDGRKTDDSERSEPLLLEDGHQHERRQQYHDKHHSSWSRPNKEDLLRFARGFWTRMRIRFKWFTIRSFRRFNADDLSAFFTLGSVGTIIWVVVGTTTFVSVVFAALNALNLQQWIARKLADYLTAETGVTVVFESAIVPKWKDSQISFKNVFISRRADNDPVSLQRDRNALAQGKRRLRRRGTATTAGEGMAWEGMHYVDEEVTEPMSDDATATENGSVNSNFTMFDLNVDSIDVQLSFRRWWDGRGIIKDAVIRGVRGTIDRRSVFWDPEKPYDPKLARRRHRRGDFELDSLQVEDLLVTIYQPGDFRPFNWSIFSARLPRFRKQWMFYDLLAADSMTGQVDGCLFSLHKPQSIGKTTDRERELNKTQWDLMVSRLDHKRG